ISSLLPTFQYAIEITRFLGLKYIWIDSLCILQDYKEDWVEESAKMGIYYSSSWLTIGA
ncbi:heterokaryon incompatibility, partial [Acephala macrosclerotiorum]